MSKEVFYTFIIFIGSLVLGFGILRVSKMSSKKKKLARKFFWYAYALLFFANGLYNFSVSFINPMGYFYTGFGVITFYYNYKGTLEDRMHL